MSIHYRYMRASTTHHNITFEYWLYRLATSYEYSEAETHTVKWRIPPRTSLNYVKRVKKGMKFEGVYQIDLYSVSTPLEYIMVNYAQVRMFAVIDHNCVISVIVNRKDRANLQSTLSKDFEISARLRAWRNAYSSRTRTLKEVSDGPSRPRYGNVPIIIRLWHWRDKP